MSDSETPQMDEVIAADSGDSSYIANLAKKGRELERELTALREERDALARKLEVATGALTRIHDCTDSPEIDVSGDYRFGLHCGVEDRDLNDRYEGADYGWSRGVERTLEWAANEAQAALESLK